MPKTILVVDDSAAIREVVGMALREAGYAVLEGADGQDALQRLHECADAKVHLVISDVNMPNMDGLSFLRAMRELPAHRFTPGIMLTTETQERLKAEGRAAGARAGMNKPFRAEAVLAAVRKFVLP